MPDQQLHDDLAAAVAAASTRDRLAGRRQGVEAALRQAEQAEHTAIATLADELADVERLESLSPTRIWASLMGSRSSDLDRERAEQQAAEYAAATAAERRASATAALASLDAEIAALGDVERRVDAARVALVRAHDPSAAARLDTLSTDLASVLQMLQETDEAGSAAGAARSALDEAASWLAKASDWATYDTFLGGGMMGDMMKYDRLDKAVVLMRQADAAMRTLATELADLGAQGVGGIEVDDLTAGFDVWLDNIFSDWSVLDRVQDARGRVDQARSRVSEVLGELEARRRAGVGRHEALLAERTAMLRGA